MSEDYPRGRFVWHELQTTDPEAAQAFYTALIGWEAKPMEGSDPPYTVFGIGEAMLGGLMKLPPAAAAAGAPPHWLGSVTVPDVDATTAQATDLGATVLMAPMDVPDMGRFSVIRDPQGAVISTWHAFGEEGGRDDAPAVGRFSWHELYATDHEAAFAFYSALFGWKKLEAVDMGPMGIYQLFGRTDVPLGGMFDKPADMPAPPHWLYYIRVADLQQAVEKVAPLGGQVLIGPMEVPGGDWIAQCLDPQGAAFALHQTAQ